MGKLKYDLNFYETILPIIFNGTDYKLSVEKLKELSIEIESLTGHEIPQGALRNICSRITRAITGNGALSEANDHSVIDRIREAWMNLNPEQPLPEMSYENTNGTTGHKKTGRGGSSHPRSAFIIPGIKCNEKRPDVDTSNLCNEAQAPTLIFNEMKVTPIMEDHINYDHSHFNRGEGVNGINWPPNYAEDLGVEGETDEIAAWLLGTAIVVLLLIILLVGFIAT